MDILDNPGVHHSEYWRSGTILIVTFSWGPPLWILYWNLLMNSLKNPKGGPHENLTIKIVPDLQYSLWWTPGVSRITMQSFGANNYWEGKNPPDTYNLEARWTGPLEPDHELCQEVRFCGKKIENVPMKSKLSESKEEYKNKLWDLSAKLVVNNFYKRDQYYYFSSCFLYFQNRCHI